MQSLRWLKSNIASFGGDPDRITLMGQSSGAATISLLMTIPESQKLFRRAILESGAVSQTTRKADAQTLTQRLMALTGKSDMAGLMSLTGEELEAVVTNDVIDASANFPILDDRILSSDIYTAFAQRSGSFDILCGSNADELNAWIALLGPENFVDLVVNSFVLTEEAISRYTSDDAALMEEFAYLTDNDYPEFFNELLFRGPAIAQAESHTGRTYMYYWEYPAQVPGLGACHDSERPYFMNNQALEYALVLYPDETVQSNIQSLVSNFIKNGNPSTQSITWPEYNASTRQTLIVTDSGAITTESAPLDDQRELIRPLLKWGVSGREMINGDLSAGISVNPDAVKPEPEPEPQPDPEPDPQPDPGPESGDRQPGRSSGKGGCNSGLSCVNLFALVMFMMRKKKS